MRELHVVALSEDGRHLVLGPSKTKGSHKVRLDARLIAAVRGELGGHGEDLSPKEIQARLRAGESAEKIARSAGMALTRVERFAGPVAGEMARMVDEAREAYVVRGRLGRSAVPMGKAVAAALGPDAGSWTTYREDDGRWRVQVAWTARGRARTAAWRFDPHTRELDAVDPASAALGHVADKPAAPRRTAAKPARKAAPAKAPAKPAKPAKAAKAAPVKTRPAKAKAAPVKPPKAKAPAKAAPKAPRPRLRVVPDPAPVKAPAKRSAADEREGVRARASVPAWADVLLGTTPSGEK